MQKKSIGWEEGAKWYDQLVGDQGHYYHQEIIVPLLKTWFEGNLGSFVDFGCGQAFFASCLPNGWEYTGYDASKSLVLAAQKKGVKNCFVQDLTLPIKNTAKQFDVGLFLLSLQDMEHPLKALENAQKVIKDGKHLWIVLNHPCFRIPRQSNWGIDESKKMQFRRVDSYMSENLIPIEIHPSKQATKKVIHHHFSLTLLTNWLHQTGFVIEKIEELVSNRKSSGAKAAMENRCRAEFPLFMCIKAKKLG